VLFTASLVIFGMGVYAAIAAPANSNYVASTVRFEGQLMDGSGNMVADGPYQLSFTLYDQASGGTILWTDANRTVTVTDGVYSVQLGDPQHPFPQSAFDGPRWLGVAVGPNQEMPQRISLSAVPFALNARQAMGIQGNMVSTTTPAAGQVLAWNSTATLWAPQTAPTANISTPAVRTYWNSTAPTIVNNTWTVLNFNVERWDTGNFHVTTTPNWSKLTVGAGQQGKYFIFANVQFAANVTGMRMVAIRLTKAAGGTTTLVSESREAANATTMAISASTVYQLATGDYVEVLVWQTSGAGLVVMNTVNYSPEFGMIRLGD
jgi:hypothetical protein